MSKRRRHAARDGSRASVERRRGRPIDAGAEDHFHPWIDRQGQSPFVWSVIGAIAEATERLELGTAVTCPSMRIHPTLVAQAAATCALLMEGRFFLGLGTGENLNEHVTGEKWPETEVRQERLEEAVEVIRLLWRGGNQSHRGRHFRGRECLHLFASGDSAAAPLGGGRAKGGGPRRTGGGRHDRH